MNTQGKRSGHVETASRADIAGFQTCSDKSNWCGRTRLGPSPHHPALAGGEAAPVSCA